MPNIVTVLMAVHSKNESYDRLFLSALQSLENQTYKNFDVIIVLDECWNNTQNILNLVKLNIIKVIKRNKKEGLAFAKNEGLKFVNTEWVTFLDADDLYTPDKLEKQIRFISDNNDYDFVGTQSWNKYNNNNILFDSCFKLGMYETHDEIKNKIYQENIMTGASMFCRMSAMRKLNFYHHIVGQEDWDLWKRAIENGYKLYQIQERLYVITLGTTVGR